MKIIENKKLDVGTHLYEVKLEENGVYFLKIEADGISETKKIVVVH